MYAWIWRQLPFGLPGKLTGVAVLAVGAAALLWYGAFPWMDPFVEQTLLPWNEGQLEGEFGPGPGAGDPGLPADPADPSGSTDPSELVGPDGEVIDDEHDLPYETDE